MSTNGNGRGRANGEGSIFPYRNGYAAYAWVTTPAGEKKRKYVYGQTREEVYGKWVQLKAAAAKVPIPTSTPTVADYLTYWLGEVIKPVTAPRMEVSLPRARRLPGVLSATVRGLVAAWLSAC